MNGQETITSLIETYSNLQRIIQAPDMKKEVEYQLKVTKAKLESIGVVTTDLKID